MIFYKLENGGILNLAQIVDFDKKELRLTNGWLGSLSEADRVGIEAVLNQKRLLYPRAQAVEASVTSDPQVTVYEPKNSEAEKALQMLKQMRILAEIKSPQGDILTKILERFDLNL
jgi:hypothetical protein